MDNLARLMAALNGLSVEKLRLVLRFVEFLVEAEVLAKEGGEHEQR